MLKQHLTHLILEMIGEDKIKQQQRVSNTPFATQADMQWYIIHGENQALQDLREKVPELVEKINNLIEYDKIKK